jgi:hypothetical protein
MHDFERALAPSAPECTAEIDTSPADYAGLRQSANIEGGYDTEFQLDLASVRSRAVEVQGKQDQEAEVWVHNGLRSLFGNMAQGQEVVFGYRWSPELNEERPFDWYAAGRSTNRGRTRSMQGAGDLRRSLETTLDAAGFELCRSEPRQRDLDTSLTWRRELGPRGIVIPCAHDRSVGFASQQRVDERVILATPGTLGMGALESFKRASGGGNEASFSRSASHGSSYPSVPLTYCAEPMRICATGLSANSDLKASLRMGCCSAPGGHEETPERFASQSRTAVATATSSEPPVPASRHYFSRWPSRTSNAAQVYA